MIVKDFNFIGEGYFIEDYEDISNALKEGYQLVTGKTPKKEGMMLIGDASKVVNFGRIPSIYFGVPLDSAHSNDERVFVQDIKKQCKVVLATIFYYFG